MSRMFPKMKSVVALGFLCMCACGASDSDPVATSQQLDERNAQGLSDQADEFQITGQASRIQEEDCHQSTFDYASIIAEAKGRTNTQADATCDTGRAQRLCDWTIVKRCSGVAYMDPATRATVEVTATYVCTE